MAEGGSGSRPHAPVQGATFWVMLIACLSGVLGGTQAVATRFALAEIAPLDLALIRFGIAASLITLLALVWGRVKISRKDMVAMAGLGVMFFGLFPYLFAAAFQYTTASRGALVMGGLPVATLFLAVALRRETLTRGKLFGAAVTLAGVLTVVGQGAFSSHDVHAEAWKGDALLLLGICIGAIYNVFSKPVLLRVPTLPFSASVMASGFLALALWGLLSGGIDWQVEASNTTWAVVAYLGTFAGFVPILMWSYALARVTPAQSAVSIGMNPVTAAAGGVVLLGEPFGFSLLLGLALVLAGIYLSTKGG